ncbi:MAG TPA: glycosyltransferase family 4 protein [Alphaproteobacteria bacterium]|nr:glycosyltransferase family 4 protein [Alphaproteobacteria bacterium]HNS43902.1 glycosyltransferase family 4 protein [Alphaproteobacteria bacterium]
MQKPSVLFVNRVYPPSRGATGRVLRDLAHAFARDGWEVTVLTSGASSSEVMDGPVRVKRVKASGKKALSAYFWVWVKLLVAALFMPKHKMIVTLTDPPMLVVAGRILARIKGSSHIHWCHDLYPDILPVLGLKISSKVMSFLKGMSRRAMKSCDRVVVVGRCMAKHLAFTGLDMSKVTIIPNWPDLELTARASMTSGVPIRVKAAANANLDGKSLRPKNPFFVDESPKFRVLYAGNLGRAHPISTILDAAALLMPDHPEIEFVFVGDGVGYERIAQERARRGLDNIRLLPAQPLSRLKELMESGDVHLISMKHEAAGMLVPSKLYAALAAGRPCILIGPDHTETARVIREYGAGRVVAQGHARQLASEILSFRTDGDKWFAAQVGANRAGEDYAPNRSISSWIKNARDTIRYRVA